MQNAPDNFRIAVEVALVTRTIDPDRYWRFVRGNITDQDLVDAIYERVSTRDDLFEAFVVMAAREIAGRNKNMKYDQQAESPLIDLHQKQESSYGKQVIEYVRLHERAANPYTIQMAGLGFVEAVRRIELLAGNYETSVK